MLDDNLCIRFMCKGTILIDDSSNARSNAAQALGEIGDTRAVKPLISCLRDSSSNFIELFLNIFTKRFSGGSHLEDYSIRRIVIEALGEIGDIRAVKPLIIRLNDEDRWVRKAAAEALGKIGWQSENEEQEITYLIASEKWNDLAAKGQSAVEPLIGCLGDTFVSVRRSAAEALGQVRDVRAVEPLIACLDDSDKYMRRNVALALGQIGDRQTVKPLIGLLDDKERFLPLSDNRICDVAYSALQKIGTQEALEACEAWVKSGNKQRKSD